MFKLKCKSFEMDGLLGDHCLIRLPNGQDLFLEGSQYQLFEDLCRTELDGLKAAVQKLCEKLNDEHLIDMIEQEGVLNPEYFNVPEQKEILHEHTHNSE